MRLKIDKFTASGTWTCPTGVTGVFATLIGAGAGAHGMYTYNIPSPPDSCPGVGGAGSGEVLESVPMVVVPGTDYPVTVGVGSVGSVSDGDVATAGTTSFNGFNALGAPGQSAPNPPFNFSYGSTGPGGGWGGAPGLKDLGHDPYPVNDPPGSSDFVRTGHRLHGWRESVCGTGGNRGGAGTSDATGTAGSTNASTYPTNQIIAMGGSFGGVHNYTGTPNPYTSGPHGYELWGGGGGGAGTYYGSLNGSPYTVHSQDADPDQYGSGAPGPGKTANTSSPPTVGGKGADGLVLIMYFN